MHHWIFSKKNTWSKKGHNNPNNVLNDLKLSKVLFISYEQIRRSTHSPCGNIFIRKGISFTQLSFTKIFLAITWNIYCIFLFCIFVLLFLKIETIMNWPIMNSTSSLLKNQVTNFNSLDHYNKPLDTCYSLKTSE